MEPLTEIQLGWLERKAQEEPQYRGFGRPGANPLELMPVRLDRMDQDLLARLIAEVRELRIQARTFQAERGMTPEMLEAARLLRAMNEDQRGLVLGWYCQSCHADVGAGEMKGRNQCAGCADEEAHAAYESAMADD